MIGTTVVSGHLHKADVRITAIQVAQSGSVGAQLVEKCKSVIHKVQILLFVLSHATSGCLLEPRVSNQGLT